MKEIIIKIPEGKKAMVTFVEEDSLPVTERIKTFYDAMKALGNNHPLVLQYRSTSATYEGDLMVKELIAYLKLRIIVVTLNEGWEPKFIEGEPRYFPWFYFYTKEQYARLDDEAKRCCSLCDTGESVCCTASYAALSTTSYLGSRLCFKTSALAIYAGEQFIKEYLDFIC